MSAILRMVTDFIIIEIPLVFIIAFKFIEQIKIVISEVINLQCGFSIPQNYSRSVTFRTISTTTISATLDLSCDSKRSLDFLEPFTSYEVTTRFSDKECIIGTFMTGITKKK